MTIDFTKPVQTKDGRKVRILCTDAGHPYPIVGLVGDSKQLCAWLPSGMRSPRGPISLDLIQVPEENDHFFNVKEYSLYGPCRFLTATPDEANLKLIFIDGKLTKAEVIK